MTSQPCPSRDRSGKPVQREAVLAKGLRLVKPAPTMDAFPEPGASASLAAVLGPTNTGKTHYALERMLAQASGMMGFPLRLLARENYDRAVARKGLAQVALITGEEKIVPPRARYFFCTVESMPLDRPVDFLAIDEIQMAADPDRGHVFTERLLKARGRNETLVLGAATIAPLLKRLYPGIRIMERPRLSRLTYAGHKKLTRLPKRSAVVAFSAADVYGLAELIRRQKGGAAVVLGALSPRTRNAQVALYQAGEVDYLVATDAIGMGLNMDVDHVAFAETRKFDGRVPRALQAQELAQIAGRAGRHMNDGTFGATADVGGLDPDDVARIENHEFESLRALQWRNPDLAFQSLEALRRSLWRKPDREGLVRAREADDERALDILARDEAVRDRAGSPDRVRLVWEVCRIPDFRKVMSEAHARLLTRLFLHLVDGDGRLPDDWVAGQVDRIDRTDGDIDVLSGRIGAIRTWTYVAHRSDWLADAVHWRDRTRAVEDRLSDALHERLIQRFIDRRNAVIVSKLKNGEDLTADIDDAGEVRVEGHRLGRLQGFRLDREARHHAGADRRVAAAAERALEPAIRDRLLAIEAENDEAFLLDGQGRLIWRGHAVAQFKAGAHALEPALQVDKSDLLDAAGRDRIARRLGAWFNAEKRRRLAPLMAALDADLPAPARGLLYRVAESYGALSRRAAGDGLALVDGEGRRHLRRLGLEIGREHLFFPQLLKPEPQGFRLLLAGLANGLDPIPDAPPPGRTAYEAA
ncbi:MAG: helicase-related protein, partial [Rhodospirillales bacterium]